MVFDAEGDDLLLELVFGMGYFRVRHVGCCVLGVICTGMQSIIGSASRMICIRLVPIVRSALQAIHFRCSPVMDLGFICFRESSLHCNFHNLL